MMFSMTGYGRAALEISGRLMTIELKSVNHRFLDVSYRMPRSLSFLEEDIRRELSARISRGHIDVFMTFQNLRDDAREVRVDHALLGAYLRAVGEIANLAGVEMRMSVSEIAKLPDVMSVEEAQEDQDAVRALMRGTIALALDEMCEMRDREGQKMRDDLIVHISAIERAALLIEERYPETVIEYQARLAERISNLIGDKVDESRLIAEVAIMADRSDISEEIARLKSHLTQLRELSDAREPVGRRLDFIVQELNRESNTISSKSQDMPITRLAIEMKSEIEKLREQLQNVE